MTAQFTAHADVTLADLTRSLDRAIGRHKEKLTKFANDLVDALESEGDVCYHLSWSNEKFEVAAELRVAQELKHIIEVEKEVTEAERIQWMVDHVARETMRRMTQLENSTSPTSNLIEERKRTAYSKAFQILTDPYAFGSF